MNLKSLCYFGVVLPLGAFLVCLALSITKDFDLANRTHCLVDNIFPSISACISNFYPQNTIWRLCIGIDSFPRYLIAIIYFDKYYARKVHFVKNPTAFRMFIKLAFGFHIVELTSLLLLTYVSSVEIFFIHMCSFVAFIVFSTLYMISTIFVYSWPREPHCALNAREQQSLRLKKRTFAVYMLSFLLSLYFYIRHNRFCEPYVYSFFSFFEYLTVLTNIFYHSLIIFDLNLNANEKKIVLLE